MNHRGRGNPQKASTDRQWGHPYRIYYKTSMPVYLLMHIVVLCRTIIHRTSPKRLHAIPTLCHKNPRSPISSLPTSWCTGSGASQEGYYQQGGVGGGFPPSGPASMPSGSAFAPPPTSSPQASLKSCASADIKYSHVRSVLLVHLAHRLLRFFRAPSPKKTIRQILLKSY